MGWRFNPHTRKLDYFAPASGGGAWGEITGTLSDQTDLQAAIDAKQDVITGGATSITSSNLTASRALASDGSGKVAVSSVTATELGYVSGVTSAIQTQLDSKGTFTLPALTSGSVLFSDGSTIAQDNQNFNWDDTNDSLRIADTLGSELVTNGDFSSATGWTVPTGWAITGGVATHNANGTGALTRSTSLTQGYIYEITYTISNWSVGTVTVTFGGYNSGALSANGTYSGRFFAMGSGNITFTPSNTARFDVDNVSIKRLSGATTNGFRSGIISAAGGGDFGDKIQVYGADTASVPNSANGGIVLHGSTYAHIKLYTSSTLRAGIVASSTGIGIHGSNVNLYSSLSTTSLSAYFTGSEARMYGNLRVAGVLAVAGKGTAGLESTSPLSTWNIYGSSAARGVYVSTNNYTLTANETFVLADVSTAAGCSGTPTACSSYSSEGTCNAHSGVGCSWEGGDCSGFTSQSVCESYSGCVWSGYADCSGISNYSSCTSTSGCSWYDPCNAYWDYSSCVGTSGCSWNSSTSECTGMGSCTGSYYVGYSCSGTYGSCTGTANCGDLSTEGACNAESGCSWSENMTLNLPQGSGLSYGTLGSTMARHYYIKKVAGDGGVVITPYSGDDIDGQPTHVIAATYDGVHLYYQAITGDCGDFTGSGQETCESYSGCYWNDTCSQYYSDYDCSNAGCSWSTSTNSCSGGTTTCEGTYAKNKRWHVVSDKQSGTIFAQTASKTVANTTTETTLVTTGSGTMTMAPNLLKVGKSIRLRIWCYHSSVSAATIRFKIKIGSTTVIDTGAHNSHNDTNKLIQLDAIITCRTAGASGTVLGQATFEEFGSSPDSNGVVNTTTSTIDTTSAQTLDVTAQWGTASASNTITCTNLVVEAI